MHVTGIVEEPQFTMDGRLRLVFEIKEKAKALEELEKLKGKQLVIDADVFRNVRSIDANAYFWQLCDKIAKVVRSDKWDVYLMELSHYGVFTDVEIKAAAVETLKRNFRAVETLNEFEYDGELFQTVRCYYGSHTYTTKEMSDLISGTVEDAKALGIETLTPDELKQMLASYKEGKQ